MTRMNMKMDGTAAGSGVSTNAIIGNLNVTNSTALQGPGTMVAVQGQAPATPTLQGTQVLGTIDCYEDVFKEITKKLYGDESGGVSIADVLDPNLLSSMTAAQPIVYDAADLFRQDVVTSTGTLSTNPTGGLAIVAAGPASNGLPAGTIVVQRRLQDDKGRIWTIEGLPQTGEQIAFATVASTDTSTLQVPQPQAQPSVLHQATIVEPQHQQQLAPGAFEERWFESEEQLNWTPSKIARYNPTQKVFRCVDCDFVGFLSRVAEHWLGNHADLRVFQCPRCPYTSAWARCVRMHLTRQHGETLTDNTLWKENPVLEEVTKYLNTLKTKVEQKIEPVNPTGEKRYTCPCCPYQTDRRDLYNRHENIHRDEKPFQCYVCDKQFNRADHVKKHFIRMHREHTYDINKIKKASPSKQGGIQLFNGGKLGSKRTETQQQQTQQDQVPRSSQNQFLQQQSQVDISQVPVKQEQAEQMAAALALEVSASDGLSLPSIPHIAYFNPPSAPGQSGPLQGIPGVGGTKKDGKSKGNRKKKSSEKMYTCSYCPWQGVDNWCLKRHLNTHIKPFLCALCDYKAARSERLATHVLKVHNKRVCHKCSYLADDSEGLSQHIQDSHQNPLVKTGFNCNICQDYFELRADLEAHAILEHQKVIVQCDLCDFRTTDELSMEAHLRDKHNLTPGMGAVAAAAAAAAAAAIGQGVNTQYMQSSSQPQINVAEPVTSADQLLSQTGVITTNPMAVIPSTSSSVNYPGSPSLSVDKLPAVLSQPSESEPETLCEKCGVDFVDEQSRKLHERRHILVNPAEDEAVKGAKTSIYKRFVRTYVCSTCSYTCATKKMMMQHQRAHTGFDLVCQAEDCQFSTPFENTLKEHIQNDHGSEEHVRCPHCGLRMPSHTAFTTHWRLHHSTICSLCVNIYRVRYDMKENDIHDFVCKVPSYSSPLFPEGATPTASSLLLKMESFSSTDFAGIHIPDHRLDDDLAGLMIPDGLDEPLLKKTKLDLSPNPSCSTSTLYKRESIKFLPRIVELKVIPMLPTVRKSSSSRRRRKRKQRHNARLPALDSSDSSQALESSLNQNKTISKLLRKMQVLETFKRSSSRVSQRRRYCQKGTYSWLYRNPREGYKCLNSLCENKCSWRYPRKSGLVLHNLWYHQISRYKCDICGLQFRHLYQAYLHKSIYHDEYLQQQEDQALINIAATQMHHQTRQFDQAHLAAMSGNPMLS